MIYIFIWTKELKLLYFILKIILELQLKYLMNDNKKNVSLFILNLFKKCMENRSVTKNII